jgi:hypothetical protein
MHDVQVTIKYTFTGTSSWLIAMVMPLRLGVTACALARAAVQSWNLKGDIDFCVVALRLATSSFYVYTGSHGTVRLQVCE